MTLNSHNRARELLERVMRSIDGRTAHRDSAGLDIRANPLFDDVRGFLAEPVATPSADEVGRNTESVSQSASPPLHLDTLPDTGAHLTADFVRAFPGGKLDDAGYEAVETALDKADAPCQAECGRWLTLPERVTALAGALSGRTTEGRSEPISSAPPSDVEASRQSGGEG